MKKKYLTPKFVVADLASGGDFLEEVYHSMLDDDEGIYSEAKRFDEWGDEIEDEEDWEEW